MSVGADICAARQRHPGRDRHMMRHWPASIVFFVVLLDSSTPTLVQHAANLRAIDRCTLAGSSSSPCAEQLHLTRAGSGTLVPMNPAWRSPAEGAEHSVNRHRRLATLALRGGSSAWNSALTQASVGGARNDLSLEDTCAALKAHGLVVSVAQVKELLGLSGAPDLERVSESHFSAAVATHPPASALGRWQQVR